MTSNPSIVEFFRSDFFRLIEKEKDASDDPRHEDVTPHIARGET